jgi:hypothetical protein
VPQKAVGGGQVEAQAPAMHAPPAKHALPQVPQLVELDVKSTQAPLQLVVPAEHWLTHAPDMHTLPAPQTMPQSPQFEGSDVRSTQVPLQMALPLAHAVPPSQTGNGSGSSDARPHPAPAIAARPEAKKSPERNRRKLDMARVPSEGPPGAQGAAHGSG